MTVPTHIRGEMEMNFKDSFHFKNRLSSYVWWYTPVLSALRRLKQEDHDFEISLAHIVRLS